MAGTPITLTDDEGRVRFEGKSVGGGGSQPVMAVYSGNAVTAPDSGAAILTFDSLDSGTELLDRTNPAMALLLEAGTYAFSGQFFCATPLTAGGHASFTVSCGGQGSNGDTLHPEFLTAGLIVSVGNAGDPVAVQVSNNDGASSRDYQLASAVLVKLA